MTGRILLVGEPGNELTELRMGLQSMGLSVEVAPDGLAALEIGKAFQPDLVISEILTNRLSGFEISARIAAGEAGFVAPVMFYTEFYRDEKARREVLNKYGAILYFVKPFQKEALKKAVSVHFQDFLKAKQQDNKQPLESVASGIAQPSLAKATAAVEGSPAVPLGSVVPQVLSSNQSAAPKKDVPPNRFRAFNADAKTIDTGVSKESSVTEAKIDHAVEHSSGSSEPEAARNVLAAESSQKPKTSHAVSSVIFASAQESMFSHLVQSNRFRIGIALALVAVALYLFRGQLSNSPESVTSTVVTQAKEDIQGSELPPSLVAELPPQVSSSSQISTSPAETAPLSTAEAPTSPSVPLADPGREIGKQSQDEPSGPDSSSPFSMSDVTGRGKGPYLRRMKSPKLPVEALGALENKTIVVRVVVDETGKVQEVTPLNRGNEETELPSSFVSSIQEWQFSRFSGKDQTTAVKYYSFRFGRNQRR